MRIVAVADTHQFHGELQVPDGDVFVHAGDMCRGGDLDELTEAARFILALPHRYKVIIAGNHDWAFVHTPEAARALFGPTVVYLQDCEATVEGVRFYGSPWQPEYNDWAFNLPRGAALAARWALIPHGIDVLVTHGPPAGIGDRYSEGGYSEVGRQGCAELRARVTAVKPRLHMFGHIHQDGGLWQEGGTTFANVTTWECERPPTVIDYDVKTRTVRPIVVPPARR
jgi:predicted phosphohydrolase